MNAANRAGWPTVDHDLTRDPEPVRAAAVDYCANGWGVLPGAVWDGQRFTLGHVPTPAKGLVPVMLSGRTLRQPREAWSWWSVAPYSVLARVGDDFDVITAPASVAEHAFRHIVAGGRAWAPVITAGARAWVLVSTETPLRQPLTRVKNLALSTPGTVLPLPPTVVPDGPVRWLIHPECVAWCPGDPNAVVKALRAAMRAVEQPRRSRS